MRTITIDWYRYIHDGHTCSRCSESYNEVKKVVDRLSPLLQEHGITVELREHRVDKGGLDQSNSLSINGKDIMALLNERGDIFTFCRSCTESTGKPTECRAFIYKNKAYESIPGEMLEDAILQEAGMPVRS